MQLQYHSSVIFVADIKVSKRFYTEILGLNIEYDFGKNIIFYGGLSIWEIPSQHVIKQQLDTRKQENRVNFELYFETTDVEALFQNLKKESLRFLHKIHEENWGQYTLRFFDPDGYLVEVGESMKTFVIRMHREGMDPGQISRKTSIPLERVNEFLSL